MRSWTVSPIWMTAANILASPVSGSRATCSTMSRHCWATSVVEAETVGSLFGNTLSGGNNAGRFVMRRPALVPLQFQFGNRKALPR